MMGQKELRIDDIQAMKSVLCGEMRTTRPRMKDASLEKSRACDVPTHARSTNVQLGVMNTRVPNTERTPNDLPVNVNVITW
jgi:hypothetical protein